MSNKTANRPNTNGNELHNVLLTNNGELNKPENEQSKIHEYNVSDNTTFGKMLNDVILSNYQLIKTDIVKQKRQPNVDDAIQDTIVKESKNLNEKLDLLKEQYPSLLVESEKYINTMTRYMWTDYKIKEIDVESEPVLKNLEEQLDNIHNSLDETKIKLNEYAELVNRVDNLIESREHLFESKNIFANHSGVTTNKFANKYQFAAKQSTSLDKFMDALIKVQINRDMADLAKRYERLVAKHFRENTSSSDMFDLESQMKAAITQEPRHRTRLKKIRNTMRNRTNRAYNYVVGRNKTSKWHSPRTPARFTNKVRGLVKRVLPKRLNVFSHLKPYYLFGKRIT